jgi:hypothetical protein
VVSSVIIRPIGVIAELSAIAKIYKYRRLHEGHHFIPMAMEVHGAFGRDMDRFIKECAHLFLNRRSRGHLSLYFCIQFLMQCVSIALQCALAFVIEKNIALVDDACSRPPITIRSHDLHASDIKKAVGKIASYHEKD